MVNRENVQKWVDALRSGKYAQARRALRDHVGFCCLGVADDVSGLGAWDGDLYVANGCAVNGVLHPHVIDWLGLNIGKCPSNPFVTIRGKTATLAAFNDYGESFAEIADAIERTYLADEAKP